MKIKNLAYLCMLHIYNKFKYFLISILLMIAGVMVFYGTFYTFLFSISNVLTERKLLGAYRNDLYKINSNYITFAYDSYYEKYRDFLIEQRRQYPIGIYWTTSGIFTNHFDSQTITQMQNQYPDLLDVNIPNQLIIPTLVSDCCLLNSVGITDQEGNPLELTTEENGYIEIAIGSGLSKWIHVNDVLTVEALGKQYIVKSILSDNTKWVRDGLLDNEVQMVSLDDYIVEPINLSACNGEECILYVNNVYLCETDASADIAAIEDNAKKSHVYLDILSMKQAERSVLKDNNKEYQFSLLLVVIMFITVVLVITVLSILGWLADSHDIGILYANGFSNKDIFRIMLYENLSKFFFAACGAYIWMCVATTKYYDQDNYKYIVFLVILILLFLLMILSSIIAYCIVNRLSPSNLLKGERFD